MLKPQQLTIPIVTGLNEAVDEKIAPEGVLARASNVRFDKAGRVVKRGAYEHNSPGDLESGLHLFDAGGEMVIGNGAMMHRSAVNASQPSPRWAPAGFAPVMHVERDFCPTDTDSLEFDSGEWWSGDYGVGVVAWKESETTVRYVVYDASTGSRWGEGVLDTSVTRFGGVRVLVATDNIYIIHADDTGSGFIFKAAVLPGAQGYLGVIAPSVTLASSGGLKASAATAWDAVPTGTGLMIAFHQSAAITITIEAYTYVSGFTNTLSTNHTLGSGCSHIAFCDGGSAYAWLGEVELSSGDISVTRVTKSTHALTSAETIRSSSVGLRNLGGVFLSDEKTVWTWNETHVLVETDMNGGSVFWLYWSECDTDANSHTGPWRRPNLAAAARPFAVDNVVHVPARGRPAGFNGGVGFETYVLNASYQYMSDVLLSFPTSNTESYDDPVPNEVFASAVLSTGLASPIAGLGRARSVSMGPDGETSRFHLYDISTGFATQQQFGSIDSASALLFEGNVTRYVCSVGTNACERFAGKTFPTDGLIKVIDTADVRELIQPHGPIIAAMRPSSLGGSMTSSSDYQFVAVWEWYSNGTRYQSAPSPAETVSLGASDQAVYVYVTMPAVGGVGKASDYSEMKVVLYRSESNGGGSGIFYRLLNSTSSEGVADADEDTPYVNLFVSVGDDDIQGNEVLYTSQSLQNDLVPGGSAACVHKSRLWVGGGLDPYRIYYSHPRAFGLPPRFSLAMYLDIPAESRVTAMAPLGDMLAVFTEDAVYVILGDGPNTLGQPVDGFRVQLAASGVGAVSQASVLETPTGVFFESRRGLRLIGADLQVAPVGHAVQDVWEAGELVGVAYSVVEEASYFVLSSDSSALLVFDHIHQVWTVDYPATLRGSHVSAIPFGGRVAVLGSDGAVYRYKPGKRLDTSISGSAQFTMDIETAWLKMGEATGFKRLMWVHVLGEAGEGHGIEIDVTSGYTDGSTRKTTHAWGESDIAALDHLELRAHLLYQRGSAFKVRVRELTAPVTPTAGFQLNAIGLLWGSRGTLTKTRTEGGK